MQGSILIVGDNRNLILGDDGARYEFASDQWRSVDTTPVVGLRVDFVAHGSNAVDIYALHVAATPRAPDATVADPSPPVAEPGEPPLMKQRLGPLLFVDRTIVLGMTVATLGMVVGATLLVYMILNIEVPQVVRLVALVPSPGTIVMDDVGDSTELTVQGYYSDLSLEDINPDLISYESTDPSIVSVSPDGTVTAEAQGATDIVIRLGGTTQRIHALVFGEIPTLPPIDPTMVGPIPGLEEEVNAVLNRVIIELGTRLDASDAQDVAEELSGELIFSHDVFSLHVIEFNSDTNALLDVLENLAADPRVVDAYPDLIFEPLDHPIDTLMLPEEYYPQNGKDAYRVAGFDSAWRIMEQAAPILEPVMVWILEKGDLQITDEDDPAVVSREFDVNRFHIPSGLFSEIGGTDHHAAAVAGVIAARNHEGTGDYPAENMSGIIASVPGLQYDIISLNRNLELLAYSNVLWVSGVQNELRNLNVDEALIDVANMSFAKYPDAWPTLGFRGRMERIIEAMPNITFVVGAGNKAIDAGGIIPANLSLSLNNVITVGGANVDAYRNQYSGRHSSSAFGQAVNLAAPFWVWTIDLNDPEGYYSLSGTSFSAPMVTGAVALLKAIDPALTPAEIRRRLIESGDKLDICTKNILCTVADLEEWSFLRADKAVTQLLKDRVKADADDRVVVPVEEDRVEGSFMVIGSDIRNAGEIVWPFHVEAFVRSPDGQENRIKSKSQNVAVAPQKSLLFTGGFWAGQPGCWDMRVRMWMFPPNTDNHLRHALTELEAVNSEEHGLLADTDWIEEVIEVRPAGAPNDALDCAGSNQSTPFKLEDYGNELSSSPGYNVLLLADTSGSMGGGKVEALKEAIDIFVNEARNIQIEAKAGAAREPSHIGMVDFDSGYRRVLPMDPADIFDDNILEWQGAIDSLDADGGTALYDAVIRSVEELESEGAPGKGSILIALTDGSDEDSRNSLGAAIEVLEGSTVTMYAVALSETGGAGDYDFEVLDQLARAGRGSAYTAHTGNLDSVYELFSTIFAIQ